MDYNYFNSKKYLLLLLFVCTVFAIMTAKVFDYMPESLPDTEYSGYTPEAGRNLSTPQDEQRTYNTEENTAEEEEDDDNDEEDETASNKSTYDEQHKSGHIDFMPQYAYSTNDLEEIPMPKGAKEENINVIDTN